MDRFTHEHIQRDRRTFCDHDLIKEGKSIIMISSEMPELLGMADRVMVMCEGRVTGFLDREEADSVSVMRLATKFM